MEGEEREKASIIKSLCNSCTCLATALAKSLTVSVLPVPAGPSGAPPK